MSKATRNRQQSARERIAAQQAAARRAGVRKRMLIAGGSIVAVLAVVVAFIIIEISKGQPAGPASAVTGTALPASVIRDVTTVPASTLNTVGAGSAPATFRTPVTSISTDTFPDTATLTFYKSSYSSKYLTFTAVENEKIDHSPLQDTTPRQQAVWAKYQPAPPPAAIRSSTSATSTC